MTLCVRCDKPINPDLDGPTATIHGYCILLPGGPRKRSAKPRVTSAQAHRILRDVTAKFRVHIEADRDHNRWLKSVGRATYPVSLPVLRRNWEPYWDGAQGTVPYAILWEGGPVEWVYQYLNGEADPELLTEGIRTHVQREPVPGTFLEAGTSFILCIFPD